MNEFRCEHNFYGDGCLECQEIIMTDNNFKVYTLQNTDENISQCHHWAEGLSMYIEKDGVVLNLDSKELQKLVKALPRTFGGRY